MFKSPKMGFNRAQKFRRFLVFFLIVNGILMPIWGFNYSKIAKTWFLIDPNTFFDDSGTSKISKIFGPVVDPRTFYLSWIYFKKYKKKIWKHPWKKWIFEIWESENLKIFEKSCVPDFWIFEISKFEDLKFRNLKIWNFEDLFFW